MMPKKPPQPRVAYEPIDEIDEAALKAAYDFIFERVAAKLEHEKEED